MRLIDADTLQAKMYHEAFETDTKMQRWDSGCWIRYKLFENILDNLPSAERKGKWILIKGSNGKDYHKCSECLHTQEITGVKNYCAAAELAIDALKAQRWIPCSERLPEDKQRVIIQMYNGYMEIIEFSTIGLTDHILAWMPLPEPYKEEPDD